MNLSLLPQVSVVWSLWIEFRTDWLDISLTVEIVPPPLSLSLLPSPRPPHSNFLSTSPNFSISPNGGASIVHSPEAPSVIFDASFFPITHIESIV